VPFQGYEAHVLQSLKALLLCSRMVLRHPSVWHAVYREEGCFRTAITQGRVRPQRNPG
jgi:hypothetical protein